jgi:hypothetical protein
MLYDRAANQGVTSYGYDLAGHLSRLTTGGGTVASFILPVIPGQPAASPVPTDAMGLPAVP